MAKYLALTFMFIFFYCMISLGKADDKINVYGTFVGDPVGKLVDADLFELLHEFDYIDAGGATWRVSKGFKSDGASIPWPFWTFIGSPWTGYYRYAAIVHDYFCAKKYYDWEVVHMNFYSGMRAKGVSKAKAWIMYQAVYEFGTGCRWEKKIGDLPEACVPGEKFDASKCIHNDILIMGRDLGPRKKLNRRNLEFFLERMSAEGYEAEVEVLRQQRSIRDILSN